ncbi:MAG TPA: type II toxin-antitoxin system prevent-host-death family antitoxin [Thermoanaerobaculia bacterium]|nr:type II toxin-antitoxin system prevent-host-death family antitoxin [Thermoanaerobaculia bacterium]
MRSIGIAELKASLSETLARVKGGEEIVVTEHGRPIAKIIPLWAATPAVVTNDLVRSGVLRVPERALDEAFWVLPRPSDSRSSVRATLAVERREAL